MAFDNRSNNQPLLHFSIRIYSESNTEEKAIALATRFGYTLPNAYKSLGSAFKTLIEQTPNRRQRKQYESRLQALRRSASKAKEKMQQEKGKRPLR